jgi:hypothetical protein
LLSATTQSVVSGTHETAFRPLGESIGCVWLGGGEAHALALPSASDTSAAHNNAIVAKIGRRETTTPVDTTLDPL